MTYFFPASLLLGASVLLPLALEAAIPDNVPPLSALIAQVVARDDATQKELRTMQYRQDTHTEQLDSTGHVAKQQETIIIVRPGAPQELQVISVKGDRIPADPDEAARQARGQEVQRRKHDFSLKNFITRFNISFLGQGEYLGQPIYIIGFEPKPNQPYRDQTEKVLDQLHGRMWIRQRDDLILKTEATLIHPVSVAWIFARIATLDFHYELRSATSKFEPASLQVTVEVDAPLLTVRQRQTVDMTEFEPRTAVAAVKIP